MENNLNDLWKANDSFLKEHFEFSELEDGASYRNMMGDTIRVRLAYPGTEFPFVNCDESNPLCFMADGRYVEDGPCSVYDLIEKI